MHEEKKSKKKKETPVPDGAIPAYLMDREGQVRAKALSNMIKQKRKEKAVGRLPCRAAGRKWSKLRFQCRRFAGLSPAGRRWNPVC